MSWGQGGGWGQQQAQYGAAPQQGQRFGAPGGQGYGAPPGGQQYGARPGGQQYGAPPGGQQYGAPPGGQQYGAPPGGQQYGAPPGGQQYRPPGGQQYGAPAGGQQYGAAPGGQQYGAQQYGAPPGGQQYGAPPGGQGYGAPPGGAPGYGAPMGYSAAPQPPPGISPELWQWFQTVDTDRSGKITATELQQALLNGNWSHFNPETCRLMIGMFDRDRSGTIDINEFSALWKYIQQWKQCFDGFDKDRSGTIDVNELSQAFNTFGYRLSPQFCQMCVRIFDKNSVNTMQFDGFIQCCVMLKSLTDKFRSKDTNMSGMININYEDFLEMVIDTTLSK